MTSVFNLKLYNKKATFLEYYHKEGKKTDVCPRLNKVSQKKQKLKFAFAAA